MTEDDSLHAGQLLVAAPTLADPNFRRGVVLLIEHQDDEGTLGVVLNRPSDVPVSSVLPSWAELADQPPVVFHGGPVALDSALCLAARRDGRRAGGSAPDEAEGEEPLGWRALEGSPAVARMGLVDLDAPPEVLAGELTALRIFAGYAGWGKGQLAGEIEQGGWYVVDPEPRDPFSSEPSRLWSDVLRRQGGDLGLVSTFPDDPSLN